MNILQYYLQFVTEICEGARPLPDGMTLHAADDLSRAMELQAQIRQHGIAEFVRSCAAQSGIEIPEEEFASFDPDALAQALQNLPLEAEHSVDAPAEAPASEIRDIYEVFLDSVCLEDALLQYLIDILKRHDAAAFQTLSHAAARTLLDMDDFLAWLGNKELLAPVEERACVRIMDGCLARLQADGELELLAALLSGDQKTFELFRCDAPELQHLPDATYDWYCQNYLDRYYPVRFLMKFHGVSFPTAE